MMIFHDKLLKKISTGGSDVRSGHKKKSCEFIQHLILIDLTPKVNTAFFNLAQVTELPKNVLSFGGS